MISYSIVIIIMSINPNVDPINTPSVYDNEPITTRQIILLIRTAVAILRGGKETIAIATKTLEANAFLLQRISVSTFAGVMEIMGITASQVGIIYSIINRYRNPPDDRNALQGGWLFVEDEDEDENENTYFVVDENT